MGIEPVIGDFSPTEWTLHVTVGEKEQAATVGSGQTAPEPSSSETTVAQGDTVEVRFADNGTRRRLVALGSEITGQSAGETIDPLLRALLGRSTDDEVIFEENGSKRIAVVERILKAA